MTDPQLIADARAVASQGLARLDLAECRDADGQGPCRGVTTDQLDVVQIGQCVQTAREGAEKGLARARQRQGQREGQRPRTAGSQVAQIDGQGLVAQRVGRHGGQEMPALDQHVAGHRQLHAGGRCNQRAIVAPTQHGAPNWTREIPGDQLEFTQRHRPIVAQLSAPLSGFAHRQTPQRGRHCRLEQRHSYNRRPPCQEPHHHV
jgi:hypothetical protein